MKVIFAACLLLVLTITSSECSHEKKQLPQICTDVATPGNEVYNCFIAVSSVSQDACTASCRDTLDDYADECLAGGADAFKAAVATLCDPVDPDDKTCTNALTPGNEAYDCITAYASQSDDACTASCLETLRDYAEKCTGGSQAAADAYVEALETFCDENGGGGGGGSGDDAATVAATLGSTITALVVAIAAVLN